MPQTTPVVDIDISSPRYQEMDGAWVIMTTALNGLMRDVDHGGKGWVLARVEISAGRLVVCNTHESLEMLVHDIPLPTLNQEFFHITDPKDILFFDRYYKRIAKEKGSAAKYTFGFRWYGFGAFCERAYGAAKTLLEENKNLLCFTSSDTPKKTEEQHRADKKAWLDNYAKSLIMRGHETK